MAKDYHPLDSRYKGPSTAYTGRPKRMRDPDPVVVPEQNPSTAGPPDLPPKIAPPPLPQRSSSRRTGLRVLVVIIVIGMVLGFNAYIARMTNGLIFEVQTELEAMEL